MAEEVEQKIVAAALTATADAPGPKQPGLAAALERAMSEAVTLALASGVSIEDSETILAWKMEARRQVLEAVGRG